MPQCIQDKFFSFLGIENQFLKKQLSEQVLLCHAFYFWQQLPQKILTDVWKKVSFLFVSPRSVNNTYSKTVPQRNLKSNNDKIWKKALHLPTGEQYMCCSMCFNGLSIIKSYQMWRHGRFSAFDKLLAQAKHIVFVQKLGSPVQCF